MEEIKKERVVTQKDVAKLAGVSPSVVSYVINNGPRPVSEDARERVLSAIDELAYRPNRFAQQLMRNKWQSQDRNQFAVVLGGGPDNLERPFYSSVLAGIFEEARSQDRRVLSIQFLKDLADPLLFNTLVESRDIFGIMLLALEPLQLNCEEIEVLDRIVERFDNVITAERSWKNLPAVTVDLKEAGYIATQHLCSLGHKNIAYIGTKDARLDGYCQAIQECSIGEENGAKFINPDNLNTYAFGHQSAEQICNDFPQVTAVFAASDEVAIGALRCLQSHDRPVPEKIALVSIDDVIQSAYMSPALTTVHIPTHELGRRAVNLLVKRSQRNLANMPDCFIPMELIVRESCGAQA
ncbi:MAG: LacI family DNA-binding transcriptional regulator [Chloroflexota bacterium]